MAGIDAFTKLMLHCNGADASTTFTDDSASVHSSIPQANTQIDTAQSKFGGASMLLDGTGDYLAVSDSTDWDFGTSDLCIDLWFRASDNDTNIFCGRTTSGGSYLYFGFEGGLSNIRFRDYTGSNNIDFSRAVSVLVDTWYHCALTRSGSDFRLFIDGVQQGATYINANAFADRSVSLDIGAMTQNTAYYFNGHIDEFRVSVGDARWTSNFTPETAEYTSAGAYTFIDVDTDIRATHSNAIYDVNADIRTASGNIVDVNTDIRVIDISVEDIKDIDIDIRIVGDSLNDINTDIRAKYELGLYDINTDIRAKADIQFEDINTDIRIKGDILVDIYSDIRVMGINIEDISCDIRATHFVNTTNVDFVNMYFQDGDFTNTLDVTIILDVNNAINMQFKNAEDSIFSAWESYAELKEYTLSSGSGLKTVDVRFQDAGGLITESYKVFITFNDALPIGVTIEAYEDETLATQINDSVYQNDNNPFFRWNVPTDNIPYDGFSYAFDEEPLDSINIQIIDVIRDGLEVTKATPLPEMTLDIASGNFYSNGSLGTLNSNTITLENGGAQDRLDIIYIDSASTVAIEKGEEGIAPVAPIISGVSLCEILVPAGTTLIADTTLTDIREMYVNLDAYVLSNLEYGEHQLRVKAFNSCDKISNESVFNLYISNTSPEMGALEGYTDITKLFELFSSTYQSVSASIYLEWASAPNQPGPIYYYYTVDGSEPDIGDSFVSTTNVTLGAFPEGYTTIKIKPYDTISGNYGSTKEFIFIYGQPVAIGETLVVGNNGITLKQSLKEVQVNSINFNFDSARLCKIYQPLAFDASLPYELNDIVTVVHNSETLFSGYIKKIERQINISEEGVVYHCTGARGELTEIFAVRKEGTTDTASIEFDDTPLQTAISELINMNPSIIKYTQSLPIGSNVFDNFKGQTVEQILSSLFRDVNYGWYVTPDGGFVTVDLDSINPGQAKFGVYGTTVNSINPQYNVIASDLQFDGSKRYNKVIIEGAIRQVKRTFLARVYNSRLQKLTGTSLITGKWSEGGKKYKIITDQKVTKLLNTRVSYKRMISDDFSWSYLGGSSRITSYERCADNVRTYIRVNFNNSGYKEPVPYIYHFNSDPNNRSIFPQGTLGPNNIISFQYGAYNYWFESTNGPVTNTPGTRFARTGADVYADCLVETIPLRIEVTASGTADGLGSKTLRLINTNYKYIEDPDDPIDDTAEMITFANEQLLKLKDIKINGSIVLDTIDTSWTLDKTVNLINTEQGSWSTMNAKIVGIAFNFDTNTTTLELTSEYLK